MVGALGLGLGLALFWRKKNGDTQEEELPFPKEWEEILEEWVPLYPGLNDEQKALCRQITAGIVREKEFEGCAGLEVEPHMMVVVAGWASLLVLSRGMKAFGEFETVLLYPDAFRVNVEANQGGVVRSQEEIRTGEASDWGTVAVSWKDVEEVAGTGECYNVVLHEFAHLLDYAAGEINGTPKLDDNEMYAMWGEVMTGAYRKMDEQVARGEEPWLDPYALHNEGEFFAVATEAFFEDPEGFKAHLPEVYRLFAAYYRLVPPKLVPLSVPEDQRVS